MKTIFEESTRKELIARVKTISANQQPHWGKMNISQMLMHCVKWDEMTLGKVKYKRSWIGRLFGKFALPDFVGDEKPFKKNVPTLPDLKIKATGGDIHSLKNRWIALLQQYDNYSSSNFVHPFFGKMTREQIGILAYKHTDHHLRQFGV